MAKELNTLKTHNINLQLGKRLKSIVILILKRGLAF